MILFRRLTATVVTLVLLLGRVYATEGGKELDTKAAVANAQVRTAVKGFLALGPRVVEKALLNDGIPDPVIKAMMDAIRQRLTWIISGDRQNAQASIAYFKSQGALLCLLEGLKHPDMTVRLQVVEAVGQMGDEDGLEPLGTFLLAEHNESPDGTEQATVHGRLIEASIQAISVLSHVEPPRDRDGPSIRSFVERATRNVSAKGNGSSK